jgi:hypothetical protein
VAIALERRHHEFFTGREVKIKLIKAQHRTVHHLNSSIGTHCEAASVACREIYLPTQL